MTVASWPCLGGCGRTLPVTERQIVTAQGGICMKCGDAAEAVTPRPDLPVPFPLSGICPECGGDLREWTPGVFQCIGHGLSEVVSGCGFTTGGVA